MVNRLIIGIMLLLVATATNAATLTSAIAGGSCIKLSDLPASFEAVSDVHTEKGVWVDPTAGCHPSTPAAWSTSGVESVEYLSGGGERITFFRDAFSPCGTTQVDLRLRGADGLIAVYNDILVDAEVNCGFSVRLTSSDPPSDTPVPEPGAWALMVGGLVCLWIGIHYQRH